MTLSLSAAGCGGVKTGSAADHTDAPDGGGTDGDRPDGGGTGGDGSDAGGSSTCVLGTSQLGNCSL